ncbi:MAG: hypothetical protein Q9166_001135 [cf. Caloplaca sp. 2 TL-2023]
MIGRYLSRSRFWKNVLALMPELTEKKLPKKSLLQIFPSDQVNISKAGLPHPHSTTIEFLPSIRNHWPSPFETNTSAIMGSLEQQSKFEFKPITLKEFESVFPQLVDDLSQHCKKYGLPEDALKWYQDSLNHNTMGGKCNRGMSVVDTTSILLQRPLNTTEHFHSSTLGWLTELLQAFFLVSDDIMDSSQTRRGQPCWYKFPKVGMIAINDAFMLESSIYVLLRAHFSSHPSYAGFLEIFHDTTFQTEIGQLCDLLTAPEDHVDLSQFSPAKHSFIVIYKTAYYSFYLPVALALHYLSLATPNNLKQSHDILIPLGEYFQIQDDYLDAYGAPEVIGKIGTDIQDNKCSWMINQALSRANASQRKLLDECYGRKDGEKEAKVKEVYKELDLEKVYLEYEENVVGKIREMISKVDESEGLRKGVFESFLGKIYRRSK